MEEILTPSWYDEDGGDMEPVGKWESKLWERWEIKGGRGKVLDGFVFF